MFVWIRVTQFGEEEMEDLTEVSQGILLIIFLDDLFFLFRIQKFIRSFYKTLYEPFLHYFQFKKYF